MSVEAEIKLIDNASKVITNTTNNVQILGEEIDKINQKELSLAIKSNFGNLRMGLKNSFDNASNGILDFGDNFKSGFNIGLSTFSQLSIALYGVKEVLTSISNSISIITNYSDELVGVNARLNLVNDGLLSTDELWNQIYSSSIRSRSSMIDIANSVQKIKMNTDDIFSNNKEALQFAENLSKSFKISGIDSQGISASMTQLTQALSSGVLQGDEFKSLKENAPNVINLIQEYMGVTRGELQELSSEGKITSDIIKNAILGATNQINQKFEEMPITWEDVNTKFNNIAIEAFKPFLEELGKTPEKIDELSPHWEAFAYIVNDTLTQMTKGFNDFFDGISRRTKEVRGELSHLAALGLFTTADEIKTEKYGKKLAKENVGGFLNFDYYLLNSKEKADLLESTERDASARFILENANKKGLLNDEEKSLLTHLQKGGSLSVVSKGTVIGHNEKVGIEKYNNIINTDWEKRINDKALEIAKNSSKNDSYGTPIKTSGITSIASDVSDISKSINNLNDLNKAIMEINEATYHNNVANQFNGNIEIVAYGVDEEGQKAIGKATEDAIRKVFLNDYQNTQAMGVYA